LCDNCIKKRVEEVHTDGTGEMATLLNEIKSLKEWNNRISGDALNLTRALKAHCKAYRGVARIGS